MDLDGAVCQKNLSYSWCLMYADTPVDTLNKTNDTKSSLLLRKDSGPVTSLFLVLTFAQVV